MNERELLNICISERNRSLTHSRVSFIKRNALDIVIKYCVLLFNSISIRNRNYQGYTIFADEIKNTSMTNNLNETFNIALINMLKVSKMSFFKIDRKNHVRIGWFNTLKLLINYTLKVSVIIFSNIFKGKNIENKILEVTLKFFILYIELIDNEDTVFTLISDHHFFSSIIATMSKATSVVLQHGLIKEKEFYYPIYADKFYAWGIKSKEILNNDKKIDITGTYKFGSITFNKHDSKSYKNMLFCISSLDNNTVNYKIDCLYKISREFGFNLLVKCHPGSLFNIEDYKQNDDGTIVFYKEEKLSEIEFDIAVSEDSTIIIDLLTINVPFILFDKVKGYFEEYLHLLPNGNNYDEIKKCITNLSSYDFSLINEIINKRELNNGDCLILDKLSDLIQEREN